MKYATVQNKSAFISHLESEFGREDLVDAEVAPLDLVDDVVRADEGRAQHLQVNKKCLKYISGQIVLSPFCGALYAKVSQKEWFPGLVNFVPAVAYHFCLNLPKCSRNLGTTF